MKCPHCLIAFSEQYEQFVIGSDKTLQNWMIRYCKCPECDKMIVFLSGYTYSTTGGGEPEKVDFLVYPRAISRTPVSPLVPDQHSSDYKEACLVLSDSPKASSALSRRCLQSILREIAGVKGSTLNDEIDEVLKSGGLPTYLAESIDAVRNIGNFSAHPIKSTSTGEIVDVEPGEAEWLLDVLEGLFDFYFVQPAIMKAKRAALNKKLSNAGKPPMK